MTADHDRAGEGKPATAGDYEREAERTRRRLAENLDELSDRLTPGQVLNEVWTYSRVGGGTMFRTMSNVMRENPVPSLLIGAGCMLFLSEKMGLRPTSLAGFGNGGRPGKRPDGPETNGSDGAPLSASAGSMSDAAGRMAGTEASSARSMAASARSRISEAAGAASRYTAGAAGAVADTTRKTATSVADSASRAGDSARMSAHDMRHQAAAAAESARRSAQRAAGGIRDSAASMRAAFADTASSVGGAVTGGASRTRLQAADAVRQTRDGAVAFVTEQPLLCASIGVAVGAALASFLPSTEAEERLMGEASDAVKGSTSELGSEALDSAKTIADKVADRPQSATKEEGVTPEAVAEAAGKLVEGIGEGVKGAEPSSLREPVTGAAPQEFASGDPLPH